MLLCRVRLIQIYKQILTIWTFQKYILWIFQEKKSLKQYYGNANYLDAIKVHKRSDCTNFKEHKTCSLDFGDVATGYHTKFDKDNKDPMSENEE